MEKETQKFDLSQYLDMFLRHKWFFIIPLVVIYSAFVVSSYFLPKIYEAQALILIEEKKVMSPLLKSLVVSPNIQSRLNALRAEILAWPRLFQLVERLGLNKNVKGPLDLERLISSIRRNLSLKMKSREVLAISYRGRDPYDTQRLVNTLCDILIHRNIAAQTEDTESAISFIEKQLAIYKEKLNKSEAALRKFKEVYGLGIISGLDNIHSGKTPSPMGLEYTSFAGVTLSQINKKIAELEAELVFASIDCTEKHPRIKEIKRRIASLRQKRNQYIKEVAKKVKVDPNIYIKIADSLPRQQEEFARLRRDKQVNERMYAMLLERLESAKITERLDKSEERTKFVIIEPARLPLRPIKPNKLKLNFLGLILGGMTGLGFIYLLEYTDSSFKTPDELRHYFDYPVLGSISKIITEEDLKRRARLTKKVVVSILLIGLLVIGVLLSLPFLKNTNFDIPTIIFLIKEKINFWREVIVSLLKYI